MSSDYGNQAIVNAKQKDIRFPNSKNEIPLVESSKNRFTINNYNGIIGQNISMTVYNLNGRKVSQNTMLYSMENTEIQIPSILTSGTYLISVHTDQLTINKYFTIQ